MALGERRCDGEIASKTQLPGLWFVPAIKGANALLLVPNFGASRPPWTLPHGKSASPSHTGGHHLTLFVQARSCLVKHFLVSLPVAFEAMIMTGGRGFLHLPCLKSMSMTQHAPCVGFDFVLESGQAGLLTLQCQSRPRNAVQLDSIGFRCHEGILPARCVWIDAC